MAEARRILGMRVQPDGYVPPWRNFFGEPWTPAPPDEKACYSKAGGVGELPAVVDRDLAELPGEEYVMVPGVFHTLPPRHGSGGDAGMSPEVPLGTGRAYLQLNTNEGKAAVTNALPEGEEVTGDVPAEPVRTGWSSMQYIQPAGFSASELTVFSRGYYGCNMFHLTMGERAGSDGKENHAVIRYLMDMFGPRLVLTPHQKRMDQFERPSLYEGKTPLHQAILAHDVKLVQFFVERGAFVRARCTGSFFGATSHAYYGEYPLSFAVCTGQDEVATYLVENGALLNEDHDINCCYALHMAVKSDAISSAWEGRGGATPGVFLVAFYFLWYNWESIDI